MKLKLQIRMRETEYRTPTAKINLAIPSCLPNEFPMHSRRVGITVFGDCGAKISMK